jgi:hypothetical protein
MEIDGTTLFKLDTPIKIDRKTWKGYYYGDSKVVDCNIFAGIIDKEKLLKDKTYF